MNEELQTSANVLCWIRSGSGHLPWSSR